jgi:bifunctional non-homologous end joining protein LigD
MARPVARRRHADAAALPQWIRPQLTELFDAAPDGPDWLHEIRFDGYRMHARLDRGKLALLTRTELDWTHNYPAIAAAVATTCSSRSAGASGHSIGSHSDDGAISSPPAP